MQFLCTDGAVQKNMRRKKHEHCFYNSSKWKERMTRTRGDRTEGHWMDENEKKKVGSSTRRIGESSRGGVTEV